MSNHRFPLIVVAKALAEMVRKALAVIRDILVNVSYFGWRPSVVYLSGKRRRVSF